MAVSEPHILVTGEAWQYVPFGRTRLKALRLTGIAYATQTFSVNGITISVSVAGDQSFIEVNSGALVYMETGQLNWSFAGTNSSDWGEPANWNFLDIPTTDKFLGRITTAKANLGKQVEGQKLVNFQSSLAVGWPLAKDGPEKIATDEKTKAKYFSATKAKKKIISTFPASIFSGKMRLFMQAVYGAREIPFDADPPPLIQADDPDAPTLIYFTGQTPDEKGRVLNIYPDYMGLFTAPDDTFWILTITGAGRVMASQVIPRCSALVTALKDANDEDRPKIEAYIFANCYVKIPKIGDELFASGSFTYPPGGPMAYGWKWNSKGTQASIVLHEILGEGVIADTRWHARTCHLTIAYVPKTDSTPVGFTVSGTTVDGSDWIDGWGVYNIFTPIASARSSPLELYSLRAGSGTIPPLFTFPPTAIYGWYVNDEWTPLTLEAPGEYVELVVDYGNTLEKPVGYVPNIHPDIAWVEGATDGQKNWSAYRNLDYMNLGRRVEFGELSIDGRNSSYSYWTRDVEVSRGGVYMPSYSPVWGGQGIYSDAGVMGRASTRWASHRGLTDVTHVVGGAGCPAGITITNTAETGTKYTRFVIVIPGMDAEAVYLPHKEVKTPSSFSGNTGWGSISLETQLGDYWGGGWHTHAAQGASWVSSDAYSVLSIMTGGFSFPQPPDLEKDKVFFAVRSETGVGKPGGSYAALYEVNYLYPFYDRGMYACASYSGDRRVMSEVDPKNKPESAGLTSFIGWA